MANMVGSHDDVVRSTTGHIAIFVAGEQTYVPDDPVFIKECKAAGHKLVADKKVASFPLTPPEEPEKKEVTPKPPVKKRVTTRSTTKASR